MHCCFKFANCSHESRTFHVTRKCSDNNCDVNYFMDTFVKNNFMHGLSVSQSVVKYWKSPAAGDELSVSTEVIFDVATIPLCSIYTGLRDLLRELDVTVGPSLSMCLPTQTTWFWLHPHREGCSIYYAFWGMNLLLLTWFATQKNCFYGISA